MALNSIQNSAILASAGSGKTYALTNRFIYLLHCFEEPERIIALTFTRGAAGEFFQKIVEKLCSAIVDEKQADALASELSINADCERFRYLLKLLLQNMHRLNLQTLDSFFFRIVSAFTLELGLPGTLELLDETNVARTRGEARNQVVQRSGVSSSDLNEFWHAFKLATYGNDTRSVEPIIARFIESLYERYLETPEAIFWGSIDTIWPHGCPWTTTKTTDWEKLANNLLKAMPEDLGKAQKNAFETAAKYVQNYTRDEKLNGLLKNAFAAAADIFSGQASIVVRKELQLNKPLCQALADCLKAIAWHHFRRSLNNTQGVHHILQMYHERYDRIIQQKGKLTFADLTHLLAPRSEHSPMAGLDSTTRQLIDFRLDSQFDHWLFDEFQDTSRPQWQVVANLVDEVIQDSSGQRSFFYVGDTKQCLYLWRNSDDRLFYDIQHQYNAGGAERIVQHPLSTSWRSAPPIIEAVNRVFSDQTAIAATFSTDAAARWARSWQTHKTSPITQKLSGFACWIEAQKEGDSTRDELILKLLNDLNPIERKLSVGILVRKNADANAISDYLRKHSTLPIHNGSTVRPASDNSAGIALIELLQLAAHPGDTRARGFLELIDSSTKGPSLVESAKTFRKHFFETGCGYSVRWAAEQIIAHFPESDTRHHERLQLLIDRAHAFDNETTRDIDSLIEFLKASSKSDTQLEGAVIVETIHKSKGLEYDIVIFANEDKIARNEINICPLKDPAGDTEWLLQPTRKELMQADPNLQKLLDQTTSQRDFGNLCTLYVAMTRAKRGLYMISDLKGAHAASTVHFLQHVLNVEQRTSNKEHRINSGEHSEPSSRAFDVQSSKKFDVQQGSYPILWSTGDADWHLAHKPARPKPQPKVQPEPKSFPPAHPRLQLTRPSTQASTQFPAAHYLELKQTASQFGTLVHEAFEQIEWFTALPTGLDPAVEQTLRNCFAQPDIRALFTQPSKKATVWRERAFSYVEGDQFINGVFDRVVIHKDDHGAITRAEIIDFKTDRIHIRKTLQQAAEHHRPQLEAYRTALSKIVGLEAARVELKLLFTDVPELVHLT